MRTRWSCRRLLTCCLPNRLPTASRTQQRPPLRQRSMSSPHVVDRSSPRAWSPQPSRPPQPSRSPRPRSPRPVNRDRAMQRSLAPQNPAQYHSDPDVRQSVRRNNWQHGMGVPSLQRAANQLAARTAQSPSHQSPSPRSGSGFNIASGALQPVHAASQPWRHPQGLAADNSSPRALPPWQVAVSPTAAASVPPGPFPQPIPSPSLGPYTAVYGQRASAPGGGPRLVGSSALGVPSPAGPPMHSVPPPGSEVASLNAVMGQMPTSAPPHVAGSVAEVTLRCDPPSGYAGELAAALNYVDLPPRQSTHPSAAKSNDAEPPAHAIGGDGGRITHTKPVVRTPAAATCAASSMVEGASTGKSVPVGPFGQQTARQRQGGRAPNMELQKKVRRPT